jgi:hypothetical protein
VPLPVDGSMLIRFNAVRGPCVDQIVPAVSVARLLCPLANSVRPICAPAPVVELMR